MNNEEISGGSPSTRRPLILMRSASRNELGPQTNYLRPRSMAYWWDDPLSPLAFMLDRRVAAILANG